MIILDYTKNYRNLQVFVRFRGKQRKSGQFEVIRENSIYVLTLSAETCIILVHNFSVYANFI